MRSRRCSNDSQRSAKRIELKIEGTEKKSRFKKRHYDSQLLMWPQEFYTSFHFNDTEGIIKHLKKTLPLSLLGP